MPHSVIKMTGNVNVVVELDPAGVSDLPHPGGKMLRPTSMTIGFGVYEEEGVESERPGWSAGWVKVRGNLLTKDGAEGARRGEVFIGDAYDEEAGYSEWILQVVAGALQNLLSGSLGPVTIGAQAAGQSGPADGPSTPLPAASPSVDGTAAAIDWDDVLHKDIPSSARWTVAGYESRSAASVFADMTPDGLAEEARERPSGGLDTPNEAFHKLAEGYFEMLGGWRDALDALDSDLRADMVEGGLPDWARLYLSVQAQQLFAASDVLQRAVVLFHHGVSAPRLSPDYGWAYELSCSVLSPFAPVHPAAG